MEKEAKREFLINDIARSWSEKVEQERTAKEKKRMKINELDDLIKQKTECPGLTGVKIDKKIYLTESLHEEVAGCKASLNCINIC